MKHLKKITSKITVPALVVPSPKPLKIISLGLGQQSTAIYLMSSLGEIERADYAIFADTGSESAETYAYLKWLKQWQKANHGIPILCTGKKSLYRDLIHGTNSRGSRFASIPAFTKSASGKIGILKRQCTEEYKIQQVIQRIRQLYRLAPKKRMPATEIWMGISQDEIQRVKRPCKNWMSYVYPLLNYKCTKAHTCSLSYSAVYRRLDCVAWLRAHKFPVPPKSACIFCPFQGDSRWKFQKQHQPKVWKKIVRLDRSIRNSSQKGVKQPVFLHRSAIPIEQVSFRENQTELFAAEGNCICGI